MSTPTEQRPPQVTMAAWMVVIGSVVVVMTVWQQVGSLRSLESREAIQRFLDEAPAGLGLDMEGALSLLHVTSMVAAVCATASAILGWYVLQRNLQARLALTVVAVPLFVSGLVVGGFVSSVVAAAVTVLWIPPAREWFKHGTWTPPTPASKGEQRSGWPPAPGADQRPGSSSPDDASQAPGHPQQPPPASRPFGAVPDGPDRPGQSDRPDRPGQSGQSGQGSHAPGQPSYAAPSAAADQRAPGIHQPLPSDARGRDHEPPPRQVVVALALTVIFAGLTTMLAAVAVVALLSAPDLVMEEMLRQRPELADQGITTELVRTSTIVMGAVCVLWSLASIVLAAFVLRRRPWARLALMVSAGGAAGACLVSALGSPLVLLPGIAAVVTVLSLRHPDVRRWFARA